MLGAFILLGSLLTVGKAVGLDILEDIVGDFVGSCISLPELGFKLIVGSPVGLSNGSANNALDSFRFRGLNSGLSLGRKLIVGDAVGVSLVLKETVADCFGPTLGVLG